MVVGEVDEEEYITTGTRRPELTGSLGGDGDNDGNEDNEDDEDDEEASVTTDMRRPALQGRPHWGNTDLQGTLKADEKLGGW